MKSSLLLPAVATCVNLVVANPLPPTAPTVQAPAVQAPAVQASPSNTSRSATSSRYVVTHAEISQYQGDVIPSHNTTATIIQTIEKFDIVVKGTNPGALPVQCNATWIPAVAVPSNNPVGTQFSCSDLAVSALMLRQDADPSIGWWIMVELDNKQPEMWMQKDLAAEPSWTLAVGDWIFDGSDYSSPMPTQDLPTYLGHSPPKTAAAAHR